MLQARDVMQLEDGERLRAVIRCHAAFVIPGLIGAALLIALPFFFLFPLIKLGFIGATLISVSLGGGLYLALKTLMLWDANALVVSDRRVVCVRQSGLWSRAVTEWPLLGLTVTVERQGIPDAVFRTGSLLFLGRGSEIPSAFGPIASPERVAELLARLRDAGNAGFKLKEI